MIRLVFLEYSANVTSAFFWVIVNGIRVKLVILCGLGYNTPKVGLNKDVMDLSEGNYYVSNLIGY